MSLAKLSQRVAHLANHLSAALLLSMFVVFIMQIVFRYWLGWPVLWTVEWVTIAWLWGILFSYAFVIKSEDMIRLDIIYLIVPTGIRRLMDIVVGLVCAGIFAWTLPKAWDYITFMSIERTAAFRWPFDLVFSIYIPFHIAAIVRMLLLAWSGIRGKESGVQVHAESHDYD